MASELCSSCGAELFAGQQFCRKCGAQTRQFSTAEIPTQILPEGQAGAPPPPHGPQGAGQTAAAQTSTDTTPLSARATGDAGGGYQSGYAGYRQQPTHSRAVPPPATPPLRSATGGRRGWLWALLAVLVASVTISALVARQFAVHWANKKREARRVVKINAPQIAVPKMPDAVVPPLPPEAEEEFDSDGPLDEEGAEVTDDKTVINKTFPLEAEGKFTLINVAGDITVEGWDREEAEVRVTKRGGTREERAAVEILRAEDGDSLGFKTAAEGAAGGRVRDVRYEVKLPRSLGQLVIAANDARVRVSNLSGGLSVRVRRGDIEMSGVGGAVSTHTMKGKTTVALADAAPTGAQVFSAVNGDVELRLKAGTNAVIKAETMDGEIDADDALKLDVRKRPGSGGNAVGTLGRGGEPILVKTVSGKIKIKS